MKDLCLCCLVGGISICLIGCARSHKEVNSLRGEGKGMTNFFGGERINNSYSWSETLYFREIHLSKEKPLEPVLNFCQKGYRASARRKPASDSRRKW